MTLTSSHNALMNSSFQLWDYGTSADLGALPSHGYLASRWKLRRLGQGAGVVSQGKTLNHTSVSKWVRNTNAVDLDITTPSPEGTVSFSQAVEEAVLWHRGLAVMTIIAHGPRGATFDVAISGQTIGTITTEGQEERTGLDIYTTTTVSALLGELGTASGMTDVTIFTNPSHAGRYQVAFAQLCFGALAPAPQRLEVRTVAQERALCSRYVRPVGAGLSGQSTTNKISFPVTHPVEMRQGPTWLPAPGQVRVVNVDSGAIVTADDPAWTTGYASTGGIRMVTTGWSGLTAGTQMVTTPVIGVLHADY